MEYQVQILSTATRDALILLLALFVAQTLFLLFHHRSKTSAMTARLGREYFQEHGEPLPRAISAAIARPPLLRPVLFAFGVSAASAIIAFVVLAFTPLSYFPNFATSEGKPVLELTALQANLQTDPIRIDGEVTNTGGETLNGLYIYLVFYDRTCATAGVRTIQLERGLAPRQTLPFFFTESRSEFVDKVGLTFSTRYQHLSHREGPAVRGAAF